MDTPEPFPITVYGKPDAMCFGCRKTKLRLNEAGIPYRYVDLTDDANAADLAALKSLGVGQAPYVITPTTEWGGLDVDNIDAAIEQYRQAVAAAAL